MYSTCRWRETRAQVSPRASALSASATWSRRSSVCRNVTWSMGGGVTSLSPTPRWDLAESIWILLCGWESYFSGQDWCCSKIVLLAFFISSLQGWLCNYALYKHGELLPWYFSGVLLSPVFSSYIMRQCSKTFTQCCVHEYGWQDSTDNLCFYGTLVLLSAYSVCMFWLKKAVGVQGSHLRRKTAYLMGGVGGVGLLIDMAKGALLCHRGKGNTALHISTGCFLGAVSVFSSLVGRK